MKNNIITHIVNEQLPNEGFKQLSFLTSNKEEYAKGIFHYGYSGSRRLTDKELSEELSENKIIRLINPIIVEDKVYLLIDEKGNLWTSNDVLFTERKQIGPSGIKPLRKAQKIFKDIKKNLTQPERRVLISH